MRMRKEVFILSIDDILPNRFQPRIKFDEKAILELSESIKKHGVIQPIIVRKIADKYEIIAGERRYKASVIAGRQTIPAIITDVDDKESAEIALIENVQRQDMTPIEEAISYKKILDMGYLNQTELATKLGKTQSTIANKLRLLNLADEVQEALLDERISERHARSLLKLEKKDQVAFLNKIIKDRMTVRKTDQIINEFLNKNKEKTIEISKIKEEKGENMNKHFNNMNNNFNIPTGNILDSNSLQQQNNNINPGFMDVDNIANSAKDLNLNQNEIIGQKKPFDPFNTPSQNVPQSEPVNPFNAPMQNEAPASEQYNPFSAPMQNEAPVPEPMNPFSAPMQNGATGPEPMNQFSAPVQNEAPVPEPMNPFSAPVQNGATGPEPINPFSAPMQNGVPASEQYNPFSAPVQNETPVPEPMNPFSAPVQNETPVPEPMNPFSAPTQNETPVPEPMNPFSAPTQNETPVPEPINPFSAPVQNGAPVPEPINPFSAPVQNEVSGPEPMNPFSAPTQNETINSSFNSSNYNSFSPMPNYPLPEEKELTPLMPNNNLNSAERPSLNVMINKIRQCINEIEASGYKIDMDELDFPNSYEFTIKIDK